MKMDTEKKNDKENQYWRIKMIDNFNVNVIEGGIYCNNKEEHFKLSIGPLLNDNLVEKLSERLEYHRHILTDPKIEVGFTFCERVVFGEFPDILDYELKLIYSFVEYDEG